MERLTLAVLVIKKGTMESVHEGHAKWSYHNHDVIKIFRASKVTKNADSEAKPRPLPAIRPVQNHSLNGQSWDDILLNVILPVRAA